MTELERVNAVDAGGVDKAPETGPHLIRITDHGKIRTWVAFALSFLETNEGRPIVFHTLPPTPENPPTAKDGEGAPAENATSANQTNKTTSKANATLAVPRLLSVVEIVKREFIKSLEAKHSPRLAGLHQYNEIGCLEDLETSEDEPREEDRATEIARALSGVNHAKRKQTPYMKITLSNSALPGLVEKGATYQPPVIRKLSKSAKMRMKKRERATKHATASEEHVGSDAMVTG